MRATFILPMTFSLFTLAAQAVSYEDLVENYQPTEKDRSLQKRFARYDVSGDSSLNMREFASSRGNARSKEISRANLLDFLKADVTGDGLLNEREYLAAHRLGKVLFSGERALNFGKADKNRDGQLSAKEWTSFAKRAAERASMAFYDDNLNGYVTWTEWLGHEPTADDFLGARLKDLKRVLPESLRSWVELEASVHADLIIGAREGAWTREVLQQLALFAPVRSNHNSSVTFNSVTFSSLSHGSLSTTVQSFGSDTMTINDITGSTYVQSGSLSVAGNSVTTPSNTQTIQLPTSATIPSLLLSSEGLSTTSQHNEVEIVPAISTGMVSFSDMLTSSSVLGEDFQIIGGRPIDNLNLTSSYSWMDYNLTSAVSDSLFSSIVSSGEMTLVTIGLPASPESTAAATSSETVDSDK